jgi:hypothetical protein
MASRLWAAAGGAGCLGRYFECRVGGSAVRVARWSACCNPSSQRTSWCSIRMHGQAQAITPSRARSRSCSTIRFGTACQTLIPAQHLMKIATHSIAQLRHSSLCNLRKYWPVLRASLALLVRAVSSSSARNLRGALLPPRRQRSSHLITYATDMGISPKSISRLSLQ